MRGKTANSLAPTAVCSLSRDPVVRPVEWRLWPYVRTPLVATSPPGVGWSQAGGYDKRPGPPGPTSQACLAPRRLALACGREERLYGQDGGSSSYQPAAYQDAMYGGL